MTAKKVNLLLIGLVALLCLALIIGAKTITSKLSKKSDDLISLQIKQSSLDEEQSQLTNAKKEIERYSPLVAITKTIVPQDKDQAETVRQIVKIAGSSDIALSEINFPKSDLGTSSKSSKLNLSQLSKVKGLSGVFQLPITITSDTDNPVRFTQFIGFLKKLENNRRTAQVTNIMLSPLPGDPSQLSFTLSINEYIKP